MTFMNRRDISFMLYELLDAGQLARFPQAAQAPLGVQATLASARIARYQGDEVAIARLFPDLMPLMGSADVREGIAAFRERRPAKFEGR